ncbi:MAG: DUF2239 family protein [Desulfobacteraceae bacterium]|nr:MAG: DUF2239 family protein [Desulfobacteraceae bacterium]
MEEQNIKSCTAFKGNQRVASGNLLKVARKVKEIIDQDEQASILIFDDVTSELVEVDFRGTIEDVLESLEKPPAGVESANALSDIDPRSQRKPGRPKLGVVSREVTLLPRHWDWLNSQPGSASVALRKLVEEARRVNSGKDKVRHSQEVAYRFMSAMAGNFPGFEEATRALFAGDSERFNSLVAPWSIDIRDHARKLSEAAFQNRV